MNPKKMQSLSLHSIISRLLWMGMKHDLWLISFTCIHRRPRGSLTWYCCHSQAFSLIGQGGDCDITGLPLHLIQRTPCIHWKKIQGFPVNGSSTAQVTLCGQYAEGQHWIRKTADITLVAASSDGSGVRYVYLYWSKLGLCNKIHTGNSNLK